MPYKTIRLLQGAMAACVGLIFIGTLWWFFFPEPQEPDLSITPGNLGSLGQIAMSDVPGSDNPEHTESMSTPNPSGSNPMESLPSNDIMHPWTGSTSDTYQNLEELLSYLSRNESHDSRKDGLQGDIPEIHAESASVAEGSAVVTYAGYAYHVGDNKVNISKLGKGNPENAGMIDFSAKYLFVYEKQLILVGNSGNALEEYSACVRLYDLTNPEAPKLQQEFIQIGNLSTCYLHDGTLYLLTADGVCACGYSRLDDVSKYKPQLSQNGEPVAWQESEISILGEPTSVQYLAATRIDVANGKINGKLALYGNIENIFYGPHWLAVVTRSRTDTLPAQENIYTFDTPFGFLGFLYTGKIDFTSVLDIQNETLPEGTVYRYPHIYSITKSGDVYRLVGNCASYETDSRDGSQTLLSIQLMAAAVNLSRDEKSWKFLNYEDYDVSSIDELLWEENRAIISVSSPSRETRFLFAEFSDMVIRLYDNKLTADHVAGIEGIIWYGSPFGNLDSLIPMGNGIYLRYNKTPDGLDIYDFSDSASPQCLCKSAGDIPETCRFDFIWEVYADDIFGIMTIAPDGNGDFRHAQYTWNIYALGNNMEKPYSLLAEYSLGERSAFRNMGFAAFEYEGQFYYITLDSDTAVALDWQTK